MDSELKRTNEIVVGQGGHVDQIVHIVDLDLEVLPLLEVILHVKALNPLRREVVADDFSHANFVPLSAHLLVKYDHPICAGKRIQVGEVLA